MKRVALHTLGCKLNQYETEAIASTLKKNGYRVVDFDDKADAYIVNTCTVTASADRKSRNSISRSMRRGDTSSIVIATGCFADAHQEELYKKGVNYVVDNKRKTHIPDIIDAHFKGEILDPECLPHDVFHYHVPQQIFHTRGMVKIQDGCDNFCSFCIIPQVRGRAQSRPHEDVLSEIRQAIRLGRREIVLTGVNMSRYHHDSLQFPELLERILDIEGDFRIRISSIEPENLKGRFMNLIGHPKLCPHLHLCLQSGSTRILLKMRRTYSSEQYEDIVHSIREKDPLFNITTDIIVGFPGETEDDFKKSCDIATRIGFSHIHVFPFSPRSNTKALRLDEKLDISIIKERSMLLRAISEHNRRNYRLQFIGKEQRILVEKSGQESYGLSEYYLPVQILASIPENTFFTTKIQALENALDPKLLGA